MKKVISLILTAALFLTAVFGLGITVIKQTASAEGELTFEDLLNAANTYDCNIEFFNGIEKNESKNVSDYVVPTHTSEPAETLGFDLNTKNGNAVHDGLPQITVFAHCMAGGAYNWSNNGYSMLAYNKDSVVFQLHNMYPNARLLWARMMDWNSICLIDLDKEIEQLEEEGMLIEGIQLDKGDSYDKYITTSITDNRPIILLYDSLDIQSYQGGEYLYKAYTYALSKVIYDFKQVNGGLLPKLNLIGYSFGGILNIRFAESHPDLIDSIYSLGTPYFGSNTATILQGIKRFKGVTNDYNHAIIEDIITADVYEAYNTIWNTYYDTHYSHINANALGGYSSVSYLLLGLYKEIEPALNDISDEEARQNAEIVVCAGFTALGLFMAGAGATTTVINEFLDTFGIDGIDTDSRLFNAVYNLLSSIGFDLQGGWFPRISLYDDGCVSVASQIGRNTGYYSFGDSLDSDYTGFNTYLKFYNVFNSNMDLLGMPASTTAVHNLHPRDAELAHYILKRILMESECSYGIYGDYRYKDAADGGISIYQYKGDKESTNAVIPSTINGKTVTEISHYAFSTEGGRNLTSVTIPYGVSVIGDYAFSGCSNLTNVNIQANYLEIIGNGAFYGCSALNQIHFNNVDKICRGAFSGCENLASVYFDLAPGKLEDGVFYNCFNLTRIYGLDILNEFTDNRYIFGAEGLYETNNHRLLYCADNSGSITVNGNVQSIGDGAFSTCQNLEAIDLNNVTFVGNWVFYGCTNLNTVTGDNVIYLSSSAFDVECPWYSDREGQTVILGSALYRYADNEATVKLYGIETVSEGAFLGNDSIETIIFDENIIGINANAFSELPNLTAIYLPHPTKVIDINFDTNGERYYTIYVDNGLYYDYCDFYQEKYLESDWANCYLSIQPYAINLNYDSENIESDTVLLGETKNLPTPEKEHHDFTGWNVCDEFGNVLCEKKFNLYANFARDNYYLTPMWKPSEYNVNFYMEYTLVGNTGYEYGKETELSELYNYINFEGFLMGLSVDGYAVEARLGSIDGEIITKIPKECSTSINVYLKLTPKIFKGRFYNTDGSFITEIELPYGEYTRVEGVFANEPPVGYYHGGWTYGTYTINQLDGCFNILLNIAGDIDLTAKYNKEHYFANITFDGEGYYSISSDLFEREDNFVIYEEGISLLSVFEKMKSYITQNFFEEGYQKIVITKDGEEILWKDYVPDLGENDTEININISFKRESYGIVVKSEENNSEQYIELLYGDYYMQEIDIYLQINMLIYGLLIDPDDERNPENVKGILLNHRDNPQLPDLTPGEEGDICVYVIPIRCTNVTFDSELSDDNVSLEKLRSKMLYVGYGMAVDLGLLSSYFDPESYSALVERYYFNGAYYLEEEKSWVIDSNNRVVKPWDLKVSNTKLWLDFQLREYTIDYEYGNDEYNGNGYWQEKDKDENGNDMLKSFNFYSIPNIYADLQTPDSIISRGFVKWNIIINGVEHGNVSSYYDIINKLTTYIQDFVYIEQYNIQLSAVSVERYNVELHYGYTDTINWYDAGTTINLANPEKPGYNGEWSNYSGQFIIMSDCSFTAVYSSKALVDCYDATDGYYKIYCVDQLFELKFESDPDRKYKIMNNIDLASDNKYNLSQWVTIPRFWGELDGGYYNILGLKMSFNTATSSNKYYGLFGQNYGIIKNVYITGVDVTDNAHYSENPPYANFFGSIAGMNCGTICDCLVGGNDAYTANIKNENGYYDQIGGIVGKNEGNGKVDYCDSYVIIESCCYTGGIVGYNLGVIRDCSNYGDMTFVWVSYNKGLGGITGYNTGNVACCRNYANISWISSSKSIEISPYLGFIIGNNNGGTYSQNANYGNDYISYYYFPLIYDQSQYCFKYDGENIGYDH